jgi:mercuric reductase
MVYDLAVIGSGGGAFAAAIAASRKDKTVIMVERGTVGGTCVNTGCVPSKALLAAAAARRVSLAGRFPGLTATPFGVTPLGLRAGKDDLVAALRQEKYVDLAAGYGWRILAGTARFTGDATAPVLEVALHDGGTTTVQAAQYLVATGSAPWAPPIDGLADAGYLTSTTAMALDTLPASMIVLGGNAVGLELAQLFAGLGVRVSVIEALDRLAPFEEPEIGAVLADVCADDGIDVCTGATVTRVDRDTAGYRVAVTSADGTGHRMAAEQVLVATGRHPVTDGLNLASVGVRTGDHGRIVVDDHLRTGNPRIWAAGDVTGQPQFVYVAAAHGTLVADNAFDNAGRTMDYRHLPRVTFTSPAVAAIGLTDAQAAAAGHRCDCRVLPLAYVPRALVERDTRGLIKLVADAGTGRLLGAHVVAEAAGELIAVAGYALANGMTVHQMADTWLPYLTMAEGLKLAAQTFTRDVSTLSCCAS